MKPRIVLDTNVFISILKKGRLRKILDLWLEDKFVLIVSETILREVVEVVRRPKFNFHSSEIEMLASLILEKALIINPHHLLKVCSDPKDNKFIECAAAGKADYIVSGDSDLLILEKYHKIEIISPANFIQIINSK